MSHRFHGFHRYFFVLFVRFVFEKIYGVASPKKARILAFFIFHFPFSIYFLIFARKLLSNT